MKIACCTLEMVTLIFLLFVSFNGGFSYLDGANAGFVPASTTELVSSWGEPDRIVAADDLGFASSQFDAIEIWSYANPARFVVVRNGTVVSVRSG
jgi:hypothetical protein